MNDYGQSRDKLETHWETWVHSLPFDTRVAAALDRLYRARLLKLDPEKDKTAYCNLARREALLQSLIRRYRKDGFINTDKL